jgi:hypothetical protein
MELDPGASRFAIRTCWTQYSLASSAIGIPRLPRPAETPMLPDPECETSKGTDRQEEADNEGKSPP